mgnify:CR=1 FL=1
MGLGSGVWGRRPYAHDLTAGDRIGYFCGSRFPVIRHLATLKRGFAVTGFGDMGSVKGIGISIQRLITANCLIGDGMGKRARKLSTSSVRLGSSLCAAVVAITAGSTQPASGDLITRLGPALMMQPAGQPVSKPATPAPVPQPKLEDAKEPDTHGPKAADTKAPDNAANLPDDGPSLRIGKMVINYRFEHPQACLLYTSPSPRD